MMSTGKLFMIAPSTSTSPPSTIGGRMPGSAEVARSARHTGPVSWMCGLQVDRLVETAKNGRQALSIASSPKWWRSRVATLLPRVSEMIGMV